MEQGFTHYEFVNSQTGHVIGYLSLPAEKEETERQAELEKKRAELAIANTLYVELIYWQDPGHPVR